MIKMPSIEEICMGYLERDYWKENNEPNGSLNKILKNILKRCKKSSDYNPYDDMPEEPKHTLFDGDIKE